MSQIQSWGSLTSKKQKWNLNPSWVTLNRNWVRKLSLGLKYYSTRKCKNTVRDERHIKDSNAALVMFQMAMATSYVRQKPHRKAMPQTWVLPTEGKGTARPWSLDCCVGNLWSGRWSLILSPTWMAGSGRKRSTRSCGTRPSITWPDGPSYRTLNTWQTRSARLSTVSFRRKFETYAATILL